MSILDRIYETQVWKSIFRHPMPTDRRNRVVVMLTNFFLHLHPVSVRKQGIALSYTWCMGGTTFFLFIVEVVTGVLLMFYYRPTLEHAYNDILALRDVTTLGILRELHRWGAARHGHRGLAAHVPRVPDRQLQTAARVQLGDRRDPAGLDAPAVVHRLSAALGPARDLGHHGRLEHGTGDPRCSGWKGPGRQLLELNGVKLITLGVGREVRTPGRAERGRDDPEPLLRAALRGDPAGGGPADHDPLLAGPEGRRNQRPDVI